MDVGSPKSGLEDLSDFLKKDGCTLAGGLDLSFVINKEEKAEDYACDDLVSSNEYVDLIDQGQQGPSLASDSRNYETSGSPSETFCSPLQTGFDNEVFLNGTRFVGDQDMLQSPSKENHHQEETEELCGKLHKSSFQVEVEAFHQVIAAEVLPDHPQKFPSIEDANQKEELEDRPTSLPHGETVKETPLETLKDELTKSELAYKEVEEEVSDLQTEKLYSSPRSYRGTNETQSRNISYSSRKLEMIPSDQHNLERSPQLSKSPETARQNFGSPDMSPGVYPSPSDQKTFASQQVLQDLQHSSSSRRQKHCPSSEKYDLSKEVPSKDHSLRASGQDPVSPQGSRQHMDGSSVERVFASPRNHDSHRKHRRRNLSVSRSPVRQRDSSSGHKRDHHNRSRSRSPYKRDYNRRSPRRKYSPRHRSPPSGYHSSRRSPRRRPWSPPHNRSTGIGKPGKNVFVAGFNFLTTERELERKFSRFGHVQDVRIVRDKRSGDSRGFGFLSFERDEEADAAIRALDETEWNGRIVLVEKSKSH